MHKLSRHITVTWSVKCVFVLRITKFAVILVNHLVSNSVQFLSHLLSLSVLHRNVMKKLAIKHVIDRWSHKDIFSRSSSCFGFAHLCGTPILLSRQPEKAGLNFVGRATVQEGPHDIAQQRCYIL